MRYRADSQNLGEESKEQISDKLILSEESNESM